LWLTGNISGTLNHLEERKTINQDIHGVFAGLPDDAVG